MEAKLKRLFECQHSVNNARLASLIDETQKRYNVTELDLCDIECVAAAGEAGKYMADRLFS